MKILVTGVAGFIGFHTTMRLLRRGDRIVGLDSINEYYDPALKRARLAVLQETAEASGAQYSFHQVDMADRPALDACFAQGGFDRVIHLAAQAGVRYSMVNPHSYVQSNLVGFTNILEACRHSSIAHLTYASSSSVYGANTTMPSSEHHGADHPLQFYAATKRANELMAHSYAHIFKLPSTGLRFFTVYGPWGRPDMALFKFTKNIIEGQPIQLFNNGNHVRDFTYVDDLVGGVVLASDRIASPNPRWDSGNPDPATSNAPWRIYNVGNSRPVKLLDYIDAIERTLNKKAIVELLPLQPGDVPDTFADTRELAADVGYKPVVPIGEGVARFVDWYRKFYNT